MPTYVGGTRTRLISDSFYQMIRQSLVALDWFNPARQHEPVELHRGEVSWDEPTAINTLAISEVDITDAYIELGSNLTEDRWAVYVDFYAESDSLGTHMAGDVRDILRGKLPSIGRNSPSLPVYDYTQVLDPNVDVAPLLFHVEIENVMLDRAHNASRPWMRHWYSVRADLVDTYGDEDD